MKQVRGKTVEYIWDYKRDCPVNIEEFKKRTQKEKEIKKQLKQKNARNQGKLF